MSEPASPAGSQLLSPRESASSSFRRAGSPQSPSRQHTPTIGQDHSRRDFARILRPEIYHPLTQLDTPPSFRSSSKQPSPETPLDGLLQTGHFRAAAISAANKLTLSVSPNDHVTIFELLYIRLVCLTLCGNTALAAQEVKALEDLNSGTYRDDLSQKHLVPWELRVLAVRLQGMGFSDSRKGVVGYYDLAKEAREEITRLKGAFGDAGIEERKMWNLRLEDLSIRVASALVEMGDLSAAASHLATLKEREHGQIGLTKALLWLKIGDTNAARRAVEESGEDAGVVAALSSMADGEYINAISEWRKLCERDADNEMYAQNLAVCLLYSGRMNEVSPIFVQFTSTSANMVVGKRHPRKADR